MVNKEKQFIPTSSLPSPGWRDGITCPQAGGMDLGGGRGRETGVPSWARSIWLGFKGWGNFDVQVWAGQVRFLRWMGF